MQKDFDGWHAQKKHLHTVRSHTNVRTDDIWWTALGVNVGYEQDGKNKNFERPVLVLRRFGYKLFIGVPLTSQSENNALFYHKITYACVDYFVILSQIRLLSTKRVLRFIRRISKKELVDIRNRV